MTTTHARGAGPADFNDSRQAAAFFAARLSFQSDVSDVRAGLGEGFVLIDSRSRAAWDQGHIPGAVHLPTAEIATRAAELLDPAVPVVTYCWGPGCNGATRAALALSLAGYSVKEMIGGIEYWIREGFPLRTADGDVRAEPDPLTAPAPSGLRTAPIAGLITLDGEPPACGC
ncbi:rhodanese-like domain-containing protein [Paractinoplanes atraurantiacus]|uniref:Rhodanese-related sulfurtransferase n=1 Tax=Paractinoplanes atraurantiacus TaxID=1036182 RepID=A0A285GZ43_9ACTN|nr:rhodanese-like domain-containing protein [Actinoplanes atraurantiacus]SNY28738.1 Rhodanese-related sulfurtransferase [Actinoplanes atraurantiacus]